MAPQRRRLSAAWRTATVQVFGHDVFVSHSHADGSAYAANLFAQLEANGLRVALDAHDFQLGEALDPRIRRDVRRSSNLILLDTPGARESPFVAQEIAHAIGHRRIVIRIVSAAAEAVNVAGWRLLSSLERSHLAGAISQNEHPAAFEAGSCSAEVLSRIRSSIGVLTVRRRVGATLVFLASLTVLAGGYYATSQWLSGRLQALNQVLANPEYSLDQRRAEIADFAGGFSAVLAERLFPLELDAVLDRAQSLSVTLSPEDRQSSPLAVSPSGRTVVTQSGSTAELTMRRDGHDVAHCVPIGTTQARFAVSDSGDRLISVSHGAVNVWDTSDCSHPVATRLVDASALNDLAIDREAETIVLVWPKHLVKLKLNAGMLTADVLDETRAAGIASDAGDETDIRDARLSADGSVLVFAVEGHVTKEVFALCLAAPSLQRLKCQSPQAIGSVNGYVLDWSGTHLVTSDDASMLTTWGLDLFDPPGDYGPQPLFKRKLSFILSNLTSSTETPAVLGLDKAGRALRIFDVPSLTPDGRLELPTDPGGAEHLPRTGEAPRIRGLLHRPAYAPATGTSFVHPRCGAVERLPPTRFEVAAFSSDCSQLAVLMSGPEHSTVAYFDVQKGSTFRAPGLILRGGRMLQAAATDVEFDASRGRLHVLIANEQIHTSVRQTVPLSRQAIIESLKDATPETVGGFVLR